MENNALKDAKTNLTLQFNQKFCCNLKKKPHSNKYIIKFMITEIEATNGPKKNSKAI